MHLIQYFQQIILNLIKLKVNVESNFAQIMVLIYLSIGKQFDILISMNNKLLFNGF